jgi:surface protein
MSWIFFICSSLTSLNLSNFKTDNVLDLTKMFYKCSSLNYLDLSNFKIQTDNLSHIFKDIKNDCQIKCSDPIITEAFEKRNNNCYLF